MPPLQPLYVPCDLPYSFCFLGSWMQRITWRLCGKLSCFLLRKTIGSKLLVVYHVATKVMNLAWATDLRHHIEVVIWDHQVQVRPEGIRKQQEQVDQILNSFSCCVAACCSLHACGIMGHFLWLVDREKKFDLACSSVCIICWHNWESAVLALMSPEHCGQNLTLFFTCLERWIVAVV